MVCACSRKPTKLPACMHLQALLKASSLHVAGTLALGQRGRAAADRSRHLYRCGFRPESSTRCSYVTSGGQVVLASLNMVSEPLTLACSICLPATALAQVHAATLPILCSSVLYCCRHCNTSDIGSELTEVVFNCHHVSCNEASWNHNESRLASSNVS